MKQRRLWTLQEDKVLKYLREQQKIKKWSTIAQKMQQEYGMPTRSGKQCRQRYFNHLDSQIKRDQWSQDQQKILYEMHFEYGNRWTLMANYLKGRSQNCIKNHFYSKVRKAVRRLNKYTIQRFKAQYQQIKTSLLYKILQVAQDKFRPGKSSNIQVMDIATSIKNRLILYEQQMNQNPKQIQITRSLLNDISKINQKIKKQEKYEKNNSGFLDPKTLKKSNSFSADSEDNSDLYSSTSFNSSFQPSQDQSERSQNIKKQHKSSSLKVKHSLQIQKHQQKSLDDGYLGADLKFRSLQLRPSKSQKTLNFQIKIQDKVSDIQPTRPNNSSSFEKFEKCFSDIVKFEQSEDEFDFNDDDFLNVKSSNMDEEYGHNFFDEPGMMEFKLRVFSPRVPSDDENKMDEEGF